MTIAESISAESTGVALLSGLAFGFMNSLHCAGMCGPLVACGKGGAPFGIGYHGARVAAYAGIGVLAGSIGGAIGIESFRPGGAVFAFVFAGLMVAMAFGLGGRLVSLSGSTGIVRRVTGFVAGLSPGVRGIALGFVTPLLPCGLLYAAVALALAAGSAIDGFAVMAGFGLGIVPVLALAQWKFGQVRERLGARASAWLVRGVMLLAAAMLLWRGIAALVAGPEACCGCHGAAG
ncbi:MAG: sulfite exporter TauE/SafE family protein [Planctomycetes bacterium]|nr:sulfite exporter TauE/SafE family protein [Planctomycetota bacterium]